MQIMSFLKLQKDFTTFIRKEILRTNSNSDNIITDQREPTQFRQY